jgi:glutathione S-transferase
MLAPEELKDVHPLGKSPVITIPSAVAGEKPIVIAESGNMVEYLIEHYGAEKMLPKRYKDGYEGQVGGETEEWLRYRYFMHYAEGSLMNNLTLGLVLTIMKGPSIPFLVRPISRVIAGKFEDLFVGPNVKNNWRFLEDQLTTSSGKFLAGDKLTGADIMLVFPLEERDGYMGLNKENYPKLLAYRDMLVERDAYKRATEKVKEAGGKI